MLHIHPLLGNDRETNNGTRAIGRQRANIVVLFQPCFLCGPLRGYITLPTEFSSVSLLLCTMYNMFTFYILSCVIHSLT
jgi:hypothetical protein